ncbi:NAD(P)-dependent alcohol dehydrogenase [Streptomyces sp. PT12]|uniref:NAD(P)-dependent alcohol dehydrogenase n=1 Tax=Streptomyces sp. PT12 TaxID=1510197 RepID=UPI000DE53CC2|nr:NAD(P)-dependent alcohol dehydrogenase [Streptomyces sp. PT12]RBM14149.1 alcohol dehydrogenase [Streptomyces sp. PT12]
MRAVGAILRDPAKPFTIEEFELADPGPGEVLVRVVGVGLCHTDLLLRDRPALPLPMVFGHEGSGVVEAVGPGVRRIAPGDHVVLSYDSCGWCGQCQAGSSAYCDEFTARNLTGTRPDGTTGARDLAGGPLAARWFGQSSFATHALATERNVVPVDPALPLALLGPLACGIQTGVGSVLNSLRVPPGAGIAVFGVGTVGLAAVMAARIAGADEIVAVDLHPRRLALALELGATRAVDGAEPELAAAVGQVDHTLDTTGVPEVMHTAIAVLRPRGSCGLVGGGSGQLTVRPQLLAGRMLRYLIEGEAVPHQFIPRLIGLWKQGRLPFDRLVRSYPLTAVNEAERDAADGTAIKPVLLPGSP